MIFLASPFSSPYVFDRYWRAIMVEAVTADLTAHGHIVFSPVAFSYRLLHHNIRKWDDPWWYEWSLEFLSKADECWVLKLDGWRKSEGVQSEIAFAGDMNIPIQYVDPVTLEVRAEP